MVTSARLASENRFQIESWAINRLSGFIPNTKQVAVGDVDSRGKFHESPTEWESDLASTQVKSAKPKLGELSEFIGVLKRDKVACGEFITLHKWKSRDAKLKRRKRERGII